MGYSLLCTDLDGTLLRSDKSVSEATRRAVSAAFARGCTVTFATGRLPAALSRYADILPDRVPMICGNGSMICESGTGRLLSGSPLSADAVTALAERGFSCGVTVVVWQGDDLRIEGDNVWKARYEGHTGQISRPLSDFLQGQEAWAHKVLFYADPALIAPLHRSLLEHPVPGAHCFTSSADTLECVREGVDKGFGLLQCAEVLGLSRSETIAVGDGENDLAMLRAAGLGVAMANAEASVRGAAALICPSNDEDGVAWLIERYLRR